MSHPGSDTALLNGDNVVKETTAGVSTDLLQGPGTDQPLSRGGKWIVPNHQGSAVALTDGSGNVTQSYGYKPFGELTNSPTDSNPFQFTGRENDGTGLMYYRARYYVPQWGRFLSEDPVGVDVTGNPFVYCGNNPVNGTDPSGRFAPALAALTLTQPELWPLAIAVGAAIGVVVLVQNADNIANSLRDYFSRSEGPSPTRRLPGPGPNPPKAQHRPGQPGAPNATPRTGREMPQGDPDLTPQKLLGRGGADILGEPVSETGPGIRPRWKLPGDPSDPDYGPGQIPDPLHSIVPSE
jgi:RHS repeat-associated protein